VAPQDPAQALAAAKAQYAQQAQLIACLGVSSNPMPTDEELLRRLGFGGMRSQECRVGQPRVAKPPAIPLAEGAGSRGALSSMFDHLSKAPPTSDAIMKHSNNGKRPLSPLQTDQPSARTLKNNSMYACAQERQRPRLG
jgi:hypothetical protein